MSTDPAAALRAIALQVIEELEEGDGNGPEHAHEVRGVWDDDGGNPLGNGELSGKPCEWCATWAKFREHAGLPPIVR